MIKNIQKSDSATGQDGVEEDDDNQKNRVECHYRHGDDGGNDDGDANGNGDGGRHDGEGNVGGIGSWGENLLGMQDQKHSSDEAGDTGRGSTNAGNGAANGDMFENLTDFGVVADHDMMLHNVEGVGVGGVVAGHGGVSGVEVGLDADSGDSGAWGMSAAYEGLDLGGDATDPLNLSLAGGGELKREPEVIPPHLAVDNHQNVKTEDVEERAASVPLSRAEKKLSPAGPVKGRRSIRKTARRVAARPDGSAPGLVSDAQMAGKLTTESPINSRRDDDLLALIRKLEASISSLDVNSRLCMRDALNSLSNKAANPNMIPTREQEAMNRAAEYLVLRMLFLCGPHVLHTAPGTAGCFVPPANMGGPIGGMLGAQPLMPDGPPAPQVVPGYLQSLAPAPVAQPHFHPPVIQQHATPLAPSAQKTPQQSPQLTNAPQVQQQRNIAPKPEAAPVKQEPSDVDLRG